MSDEQVLGCRIVPLVTRGDERGRLVAIEGGREAPFAIARAYYVFATRPGVERGLHAHRRCRQLAVSLAGACTMILDDGRERRRVVLDDPARGLLIEPMVWHTMTDFSSDNVLLVLADMAYDESDYIRNYEDFRGLVGG